MFWHCVKIYFFGFQLKINHNNKLNKLNSKLEVTKVLR